MATQMIVRIAPDLKAKVNNDLSTGASTGRRIRTGPYGYFLSGRIPFLHHLYPLYPRLCFRRTNVGSQNEPVMMNNKGPAQGLPMALPVAFVLLILMRVVIFLINTVMAQILDSGNGSGVQVRGSMTKRLGTVIDR